MDQGGVSMDEVQKVWAARSARLARVPVQEEEGEYLQLARLRLGREIYAIDVQYVADIRPLERLTCVPRVPAWVAGVVNLRGRIYSVVDLLQFLGLSRDTSPEGEQKNRSREDQSRYLVVVETPAIELVLLVDEVLPIRDVPVSRIEQALGKAYALRPDYVYGIADMDGEDAMVILDLPVLLTDKQLIVHEELA
jgi:purine-binding chemotaxis protein CheW